MIFLNVPSISLLHSNKVKKKNAVPNFVLSRFIKLDSYPITFFGSINLSVGLDFAITAKIYCFLFFLRLSLCFTLHDVSASMS